MSMRRAGVWFGVGTVVVASVFLRPVGVIVAIVAFASAASLVLANRSAGGDLALRILSFSSRALPDKHGDWREAMLAELDGISGRRRRLGFALGCARAALLPPRPGAGARVIQVAVVATVLAVTGLFLYTRNRLLGASHLGSQHSVLGITADLFFLGVGAASALTAFVRSRLTLPRVRAARLYGAVGGVIVGAVALAGSLPGVAVQDVSGLQPNDWFLLAALATTLAAGAAAAWSSHDPRAGKEGGWLAGAIGGAILFIGLTTLSYTNITWFTHDPASLRAFHAWVPTADHTNYKTIAAFILNSNLETAAMIGIFVLPLFGFALGALGGTTSKLRGDTGGRTAGSSVAKSRAPAENH